MDFNMPIMNGLEAAEQIRNFQRTGKACKDMKLILVSGDQMSKDGVHFFDLSLTKPVQNNDIRRALNLR